MSLSHVIARPAGGGAYPQGPCCHPFSGCSIEPLGSPPPPRWLQLHCLTPTQLPRHDYGGYPRLSENSLECGQDFGIRPPFRPSGSLQPGFDRATPFTITMCRSPVHTRHPGALIHPLMHLLQRIGLPCCLINHVLSLPHDLLVTMFA